MQFLRKTGAFFRRHLGFCLLFAGILAMAGFYVFAWNRISENMSRAGADAPYEQLTFMDGIYVKSEREILHRYLPESSLSDSLSEPEQADFRGENLGELTVSSGGETAVCPVYECRAFAGAEHPPLLILDHSEGTLLYELTGFPVLGAAPSSSAVCAAYGIGAAADIAAVELRDADGTLIDTVTEEKDLEAFFRRFLALGDSLSENEVAQAYYDSYTAQYGTEKGISLEEKDGEMMLAWDTEEVYDEAMTFWSEGSLLVTVRTVSGVQIRDVLYLPVPGIFAAYGNYRITEPFFA